MSIRIEMDTTPLRAAVRDIADFPQPGVVFKDITPLLADPPAFSSVVDAIVVSYGRGVIDKVVGIEARGFIIAAPVAYHFGAGFVPLRKAGKLPYDTVGESYSLEYGEEQLEVHADAFGPGDRVLIVDDVLATGGTARAACNLVERTGAKVVGLAFVIELGFLDGAKQLEGRDFVSLLTY
jgi:adenine phosphoribosyltransferase